MGILLLGLFGLHAGTARNTPSAHANLSHYCSRLRDWHCTTRIKILHTSALSHTHPALGFQGGGRRGKIMWQERSSCYTYKSHSPLPQQLWHLGCLGGWKWSTEWQGSKLQDAQGRGMSSRKPLCCIKQGWNIPVEQNHLHLNMALDAAGTANTVLPTCSLVLPAPCLGGDSAPGLGASSEEEEVHICPLHHFIFLVLACH